MLHPFSESVLHWLPLFNCKKGNCLFYILSSVRFLLALSATAALFQILQQDFTQIETQEPSHYLPARASSRWTLHLFLSIFPFWLSFLVAFIYRSLLQTFWWMAACLWCENAIIERSMISWFDKERWTDVELSDRYQLLVSFFSSLSSAFSKVHTIFRHFLRLIRRENYRTSKLEDTMMRVAGNKIKSGWMALEDTKRNQTERSFNSKQANTHRRTDWQVTDWKERGEQSLNRIRDGYLKKV